MKKFLKQLAKQITNERGFTLVEIIVATMVFVTATMLFMGVFSTISNNTLLIENTRLAQQDARYAIEQISREIRNGWNYEVSVDNKSLIYQSCEDGELQDHELLFEETGDEKGYIVKRTPGEADVYITSSLSDVSDEAFSFSLDEGPGLYPLVEISLELKRSEFDRFKNDLYFTTKVGSRVREKVENCES